MQKNHYFEHETISKLVKIRGKIGKMAVLEEINWDLQEFRAFILQNDYKTDKLHTKKIIILCKIFVKYLVIHKRT